VTNVHKRINCSLTRIWLLHCTKTVHKTVTNKTNFTKNNALLPKLFSFLLIPLVSSRVITQNNVSCASLQYKATNRYVLVLFLLTEEGLTDVGKQQTKWTGYLRIPHKLNPTSNSHSRSRYLKVHPNGTGWYKWMCHTAIPSIRWWAVIHEQRGW